MICIGPKPGDRRVRPLVFGLGGGSDHFVSTMAGIPFNIWSPLKKARIESHGAATHMRIIEVKGAWSGLLSLPAGEMG